MPMYRQSNTYVSFTENQEEPELMPNEVAYHLAGLLGCPHYVAHRALAKVNPEIRFNVWGDAWVLSEAVGTIAAEITSILWADAAAYRQAMKIPLTIKVGVHGYGDNAR